MKSILAFLCFFSALSAVPTVYIENLDGASVTTIDSLTDMPLPGSPIVVEMSPRNFAVSPDQSRLYVTNANSNSVSVIDTVTNMVITNIMLSMGDGPDPIVITPDGLRLYIGCVTGDNVKVINTGTNSVEATIMGFSFPNALAITPNGNEVYVSNPGMGTGPNVKVIDNTLAMPAVSFTISDPGITGPNVLAVTPNGQQVYVTNPSTTVVNAISTSMHAVTDNITVGNGPFCVAITHDGARVYVACANATRVDVIGTSTNAVISSIVDVMLLDTPVWLAVTPDDSKVYVAIQNGGSVGVISNSVVPPTTLLVPPISVGSGPQFLAVTPDGKKVYVTNSGSDDVYVIQTSDDSILGLPISVGDTPIRIAFAGFPIPPAPGTAVTGQQSRNQFFTQIELVNVIQWAAPSSGGPFVNYLIYRDASFSVLAGEVSANGPLVFEDHNRKKGETYSYYVVAVDGLGVETEIGNVTVVGG